MPFDMSATPCVVKKVSHTHRGSGGDRKDPWYWIRDNEDPEVVDYLVEENRYAERVLAPNHKLCESILSELRKRTRDDDCSVPFPDGPYSYYTRVEKDREHAIYCRKPLGDESVETVILDVNQLVPKSGAYIDCAYCDVSPDHQSVAYAVDGSGEEVYDVYTRPINDSGVSSLQLRGASSCLEWTTDCRGFYYVRLDEQQRPRFVCYHQLDTDQAQDEVIFEETDKRFFVSLSRSEDDRYVFICTHGHNMSEWHAIDASGASYKPRMILERRPEHEYEVSHFDGWFYILTNLDALDFRLVRTPVAETSANHWQDIIAHRPGTLLEDFEVYPRGLVVLSRTHSIPSIEVYHFSGQRLHEIVFKDRAYELDLLGRREFASDEFRYGYSSLAEPERVLACNLVDFKTRRLKDESLPDPDFDPSQYESRRLFITARDGVSIPVSVLQHRTMRDQADPRPLYVYGYGAYGLSTGAHFRLGAISLVDRGFVYAIAHVRGGMEMGRQWYLDGKLHYKRRSFEDFVDCTQGLCDMGFAEQGRVVACGGSAGGLLVGAVANMAPELFAGVIAAVPFVDILTTMEDPELPLTMAEYNEWGDPADPKFYEVIAHYSPFDNIDAKRYPAFLVLSGLNDYRVSFWEPTKWAAKLREMTISGRPVLLHTNMSAGHAGASGRFDRLKEKARELTFALVAVEEAPSDDV